MAKSNEPIWWSLFSAGGVIAAFLVPIHIFLTGIAWPLGWVAGDTLDYAKMQALLSHPIARLYCFVLISLPLFHWAHRFRYTLYDGLMLKHLTIPIVIFCYGTALAGSLAAAYALWTLP